MLAVDEFKQKVVRFTIDIPRFSNCWTPLLHGTSSILDAHTSHEIVLKKDLEEAVGLYTNLVKKLIADETKSELNRWKFNAGSTRKIIALNPHLFADHSNRVAVVVEQPVNIKLPFGS